MVSGNSLFPYTEKNSVGVGDVKKLGIVLLAIVLIRLGSLVYYETKLLDEPIVVASDYNEPMGMLTVSYITNRLTPHNLAWVEIDGLAIGPESYNQDIFNNPQPSHAIKFADYTYHSIYYSQMYPGYIDEGEPIEWSEEMTVVFSNNSRQQVAIDQKVWDERNFLSSSYSSSDSHQSIRRYVVERSFELEEIQIEAGQQILELKVNTDQITLPLEKSLLLKESDRVSLTTSNRNATYVVDWMHLYFLGRDEENRSIKIHLPNEIDTPPSGNWIKKRIEEAQGQ